MVRDNRMQTLHVTPVGDTVEHTETADCPCGPRERQEDGGILVVHNAADGRR